MKIEIIRKNENFLFEAKNENGNTLLMDGSPDIGGENLAFRPMQMLLAAIGGCSGIDIVLILKKQKQEITSFAMEVEGEREKIQEHSLFRDVTLHYKLEGNLDSEKVKRAVALSIDKYCSVSKTLEATAKINYKISVNNIQVL